MKNIAEISIDDEVAYGFSYTSSLQLTVSFSGYFDLQANNYQEKPCSLVIEKWSSATVQVDDATGKIKKQPLEQGLGIISMIFSLKLTANTLEMYALTLDNRYLMLDFKDAVAGYLILG